MNTQNDLYLKPRHLAMLQQILKMHLPDCEVWAYGSRVKGTAHDGSDLDLVVHGVKDKISFQNCVDSLKNSTLPMLIDIHNWEDLPVEFQHNIKKKYVILD
ncbi:nucleotidyltransferase family protein [Moraxella sp. ZY210820]|uniref:nucleotidyltransferase family protein n=1 Tax=unclassified Moraxella TaxID=2685852 RepID=UPI002730A8B3|nr:nucleotidyltransferase domain-containing protein [Moraxella sp. ZY210820]WLF83492.1 nucleotidyltransferase domain-containing protein [Moraxella sp. ZY210820]